MAEKIICWRVSTFLLRRKKSNFRDINPTKIVIFNPRKLKIGKQWLNLKYMEVAHSVAR